jgi:hypothetical protein
MIVPGITEPACCALPLLPRAWPTAAHMTEIKKGKIVSARYTHKEETVRFHHQKIDLVLSFPLSPSRLSSRELAPHVCWHGESSRQAKHEPRAKGPPLPSRRGRRGRGLRPPVTRVATCHLEPTAI